MFFPLDSDCWKVALERKTQGAGGGDQTTTGDDDEGREHISQGNPGRMPISYQVGLVLPGPQRRWHILKKALHPGQGMTRHGRYGLTMR